MSEAPRRLRRNTVEGAVAGVAAGLADYLGIDPVLLRIGFVILALFNGFGLLLYLVCWLVIPRAEEQRAPATARSGDEPRPVPASARRNRIVVGAVLIGIGLVVLAQRIPWMYWPVVEILEAYWPVLVILAGIAFVVSGLRRAADG